MKAILHNLRFDCPECDQTIDAEPELAGTSGKCPHCKVRFIVPRRCEECGEMMSGPSAHCPRCRMARRRGAEAGGKRILPAFLLCFFFGIFGAHAFYAGRTRRGWVFLAFPAVLLLMLLIGGFSIKEPPGGFTGFIFYATAAGMWISGIAVAVMTVVDFITIITGRFRDGDGNEISEW